MKKYLKKLIFKMIEKNFVDKCVLKYVFIKSNKSKDLIVVFGGMAPQGGQAGYNYIRTLKKVNANKLFILDDFGYEKRGSYYLGENGEHFVEESTVNLIEYIKSKNKIEKVTFVGSSKGGYASLYYGFKYGCDNIIAAAMQYNLGDYLNIKSHRLILESIMGDCSESSVFYLNNLLKETIINTKHNPKLYLHYSVNEHTYDEHIKDLLKLLDSLSINYDNDIKNYYEHIEVSKYFPTYLLNTTAGILEQ